MFEIVPMLPVNMPCEWVDAQGCYMASLWWGDVLLSFYSRDAARLEPEKLNEEACRILKEVTRALSPGSESVIEADELAGKLGPCPILACVWDDFRPACCDPIFGHKSVCTIPA